VKKTISIFIFLLFSAAFGWMEQGGIIGARMSLQESGSLVSTNVDGATTNIRPNTWTNRVPVGDTGKRSSLRDYSNTYTIEFDGVLTLTPHATGVGGLDSGTLNSNILYAVYVIGQSKGRGRSNVSVIMSTNLVRPTLSTNASGKYLAWDTWRRVGAVRTHWTNGGITNISPFVQTGQGRERTMWYNTAATLNALTAGNSGTNTVFTSVDASGFIPIDCEAIITAAIVQGTTNSAAGVALKPSAGYSLAENVSAVGSKVLNVDGANVQAVFNVRIPVVSRAFLYYVLDDDDVASFAVAGYVDEL